MLTAVERWRISPGEYMMASRPIVEKNRQLVETLIDLSYVFHPDPHGDAAGSSVPHKTSPTTRIPKLTLTDVRPFGVDVHVKLLLTL